MSDFLYSVTSVGLNLLIVQTAFSFFGFITMIAYVVWITRKVSDCQYDLRIKGQGHIYLQLRTIAHFELGCSHFA